MLKHPRLVAVCGAACLAIAGPALATAFDGTYTETRVLTKDDPSTCAREESVSITISGGALTFTDSALRNYTIGFDPHPDGSFHQLHVDIGGSVVDIHGRIAGDTLDADVTNAPCEHHGHLEKK